MSRARRSVATTLSATLATMAVVPWLLLMAAPGARASTYLLHMSCTDRVFVVEWDTGFIDPGRDIVRSAAINKFRGCLVGSYDDARDTGLPRQYYDAGSRRVQEVPLVGPLLCGLVNCGNGAPPTASAR